jgi:hypothetical protein
MGGVDWLSVTFYSFLPLTTHFMNLKLQKKRIRNLALQLILMMSVMIICKKLISHDCNSYNNANTRFNGNDRCTEYIWCNVYGYMQRTITNYNVEL